MSWRFRKTFKVLPGIKLNLTANGLRATFGAAPFSVNVGPKGVYRNVSIPGTGIWDRQRIGGPFVAAVWYPRATRCISGSVRPVDSSDLACIVGNSNTQCQYGIIG
jgi:hypothetical protein